MTQPFPPRANAIARASLAGLVAAGLAGAGGGAVAAWSPLSTGVGRAPPQPVPFSHAHHVGGLGIDCRFCHASVETTASAGMPPTRTCMKCHSQVWTDAPMLEPVRRSDLEDRPLAWTRVHDLPDYVFFDHAMHVRNGVACVTCHGRVDRMPLVRRERSLLMRWCLDCHRAPQGRLVPPERVFRMEDEGEGDAAAGERLVAAYGIDVARLTDCSLCHR